MPAFFGSFTLVLPLSWDIQHFILRWEIEGLTMTFTPDAHVLPACVLLATFLL